MYTLVGVGVVFVKSYAIFFVWNCSHGRAICLILYTTILHILALRKTTFMDMGSVKRDQRMNLHGRARECENVHHHAHVIDVAERARGMRTDAHACSS